jgi:hypothetical protein
MHDPVVLSDGHTYERRHIERWLQEHSTSPVSNEELQQKAVFPNHALRNAIEEYFEQVFSVHRRAIRKTIRGPELSTKNLSSHEPLLDTINALMECSFLMNADLSTEMVLRQIMDQAKTLVGAEVASVFLVEMEQQELYSKINSTKGELRVPITAGIAGHVATMGQPLIIDDAYADKRFNRANDMKTGFRTRNMMCVPLKCKKGGVLGVVQLINKTDAGVFSRSQALSPLAEDGSSHAQVGLKFTTHDLQFLQVFASQATTAVSNSGGVLSDPGDISEPPSSSDAGDVDEVHTVCDLKKACVTRLSEKYSSEGPSADGYGWEGQSSHPAHIATQDASMSVPGTSSQLSVTDPNHENNAASEKVLEMGQVEDDRIVKRSQYQSHRSFSRYDDAFAAKKVAKVLRDAYTSWHFDALELAGLTGNRPLSTLGVYLFQKHELLRHFGLDYGKVRSFFIAIEDGYDDANPYHNRAHAASVLHGMHALLELGGIKKTSAAVFDSDVGSTCHKGMLEQMACLLAAAIHDFEHPGVTNDFLVQVGDRRAMIYNDQHVNENHHVAAAFAVLSRPDCNFLSILPKSDWCRVRKIVIELVLSTDMANGGKILKAFSDAFGVQMDGGQASQLAPSSTSDAVLLLQMAIKCADLGHLSSAWDLHVLWVSKLEEEFFAQGDKERQRGYAVSFLMDRNKPGCSKTQTGFFRFVVIPLFRSLISVVPQAQPLLDAVMKNYECWEHLEAGGASSKADLGQVEKASVKQEDGKRQSVNDECTARDTCNGELSYSGAAISNLHPMGTEPAIRGNEGASQIRRNSKRSGRARQRAAKWWAAVRRETPSPELRLLTPSCSPRRFASSHL